MLSVEDIKEVLSTEIIGIVPEDDAILSASNRGMPVVCNGKGPAALAYRDIARRLSGEHVPLEIPQALGWWQRLFGKAS
jgi:septum site-determining protein MinD